MKAMLLAAGYGERLAPLTRDLPKPLLPVLGRPLAPQILTRMAAAGFDEVTINLHHLADTVRKALGDGASLGLRALHFSVEEGGILGTGGGLKNAESLLRGGGTILVRNSDFLADIALDRALADHRASGCLATLVLVPRRSGYTPVAIDGDRRIVRFGALDGGGETGGWLFTGCHLVEEEVLGLLPSGVPSQIVSDLYVRLARERRLNAFVHDGLWWEFGTPREYLEGSLAIVDLETADRMRLGEFDPVRPLGEARVAEGPGVEISAPGLALSGRLVIGLGARLGEGARLEDTVIMPGAWVGPGATLRRTIVGPETEVPAGFHVDEALVAADGDPSAPLPNGVERAGPLLIRRFGGARR